MWIKLRWMTTLQTAVPKALRLSCCYNYSPREWVGNGFTRVRLSVCRCAFPDHNFCSTLSPDLNVRIQAGPGHHKSRLSLSIKIIWSISRLHTYCVSLNLGHF